MTRARLFLKAVAFAAALAVLVGGCGGNGAGGDIDKYAAAACGSSADEAMATAVTYGDYASAFRDVLSELRGVEPPPELAKWHRANLMTVNAMLEVVKDKPSDDIFDPWEILGVGLLYSGMLEEAQQGVPPETVAVLVAHGCEWSDDEEATFATTTTTTATTVPPTAEVLSPNEGSGTGPSTSRWRLSPGVWTVTFTVSGNLSSYGTAAAVSVQAYDFTGQRDLVVNDIAVSGSWSGVIVIGSGLFDLQPGKVTFEIHTAQNAAWTLVVS